jgi:hypothetical protein
MPHLVRPFRIFGISLAAAGTLGLGSLRAAPDVAEFDQNGEKWSVTILPQGEAAEAETGIVITPAIPAVEAAAEEPETPEPAPAVDGTAATQELPSDPKELAVLYGDVYRSIPYRRAEWDANPGYRHDATMELLTGNPRPTVQQLQVPYASPGFAPALPFGYGFGGYPYGFYTAPFGYDNYYDYSGGFYSVSPRLFGHEGGWRTRSYINGGYGVPYALWW